MESGNWPPEHSDALREFLMRGMSYSQIAVTINEKFGTCYTRNATISRGRRMGLGVPKRVDDWPPPPWSREPRLSKSVPKTPPAPRPEKLSQPSAEDEAGEPIRLRCVGVSPRLLPLTKLDDGDCRYPYGGDREGEAILFCGHPCLAGSRYCAPHFQLTRDDGATSERAAGPVVLRLVEAA